MHDALARIGHRNIRHAEIRDVALQRVHLQPALRLGNAGAAILRRHVMIRHRNRRVRPPHPPPSQPQPLKRLRTRHLMHKMPINIEHARAITHAVHHMGIPDFVEQGP
jgi:hypothetical protein